MIPPIVHEIEARTALNPVQGMPFKWSLNPYKGCRHACSYCYARAYHAYLDLPASAFETQLFVKTNLAEVLRTELRRPSWQGESIAVGTATDPYQPLEAQYRITRQCLEVLNEAGNPCSITTKGTLVRRDIDVLSDLARYADVAVHISLISLDGELLRKLEPGAPAPSARLDTVERLSAAGIPVSVALAPVLPGITDQPEALRAVIHAAAERGARDVWTAALRLTPGVKEYFMDVLKREFRSLAPTYRQLYAARPNLPAGYQLRIEDQARGFRRSEGLPVPEADRPAAPPRGQLALPL